MGRKEKVRYLPYEKIFNEEGKSWGLIGRDKAGNEFGIGLGETLEIARDKLHAWVLFCLSAAADKGIDGEKWLSKKESRDDLEFTASDLSASKRRLKVARGLEERVADRRKDGTREGGDGRREGDAAVTVYERDRVSQSSPEET